MNDETEPRAGATPEQSDQPEMVRGVHGALVTREDYDFTTRCMDAAWSHMVEFYGPDGIKEIRSGLSKVGVRRFTAAVLNAINADGMVIAAASDVLTPERKAAIGRAERAIRGALEPSESPMRTMVYLTSITDDDLATLREMAS
ncbi:MAG: hypothetical protein IT337_13710 [Thermomicrobiales bacterium]|nr:hypothetical protein [Thermomicrobiales bacterium]